MKISMDVDTGKLISALDKLPAHYKKHINNRLSDAAVKIQREARSKHKYTTRSGQLDRSVQTKRNKKSMTVTIFLNPHTAVYALRVHEGGGNKRDSLGRLMTNKPDRFLYEAAERKRKDVYMGIRSAMELAIRQAGL